MVMQKSVSFYYDPQTSSMIALDATPVDGPLEGEGDEDIGPSSGDEMQESYL